MRTFVIYYYLLDYEYKEHRYDLHYTRVERWRRVKLAQSSFDRGSKESMKITRKNNEKNFVADLKGDNELDGTHFTSFPHSCSRFCSSWCCLLWAWVRCLGWFAASAPSSARKCRPPRMCASLSLYVSVAFFSASSMSLQWVTSSCSWFFFFFTA